jgi:putative thioredoxin
MRSNQSSSTIPEVSMSASPHVYDVGESTFTERVIDKSQQVPVLVDFWAEWCGPCRMLTPVLEELAREYQGQLAVAKVNIDEEQGLASQFSVRSVPTVQLFRHGKAVDGFVGAQPKGQIQRLVEKYVERESDRVRNRAQAAAATGNVTGAIDMLRHALQTESEDIGLQIDLARLLLDGGQVDEAAELLERLRTNPRSAADARSLLGRLELVRAVASAPSATALESTLTAQPDNSEVRYLLGARKILSGDYQQGLDELLELLRRDRKFGDDAARRALLTVLDMLGPGHELTSRYRSLMFTALH